MTGYQSKRAMAQGKLDSMEREALKLALRDLEEAEIATNSTYESTALKALAHPAQDYAE